VATAVEAAAMTDHVRRLYAAAAGVLVLFLTWAVVAAHPWQAPPRTAEQRQLAALHRRELQVRREALQVRRVVSRRWASYRVALHRREVEIAAARRRHAAALAAAQAAAARAAAAASAVQAAAAAPAPVASGAPVSAPVAAAPSVRVVSLPPITVTRTS
jgi:hypothetical protein